MTTFCPLSTQPVFLSGQIQTGAYIQVFDAGTLTPRTAYKDGLAQTPWAQIQPGTTPPPGSLVTDGNGCIPNFWVVGNPYKVRITSQSGVQIREVDNLPGDVAQGGGGGGGGGGGATLKTGDYVWAHTTAVITGRVRANGKTIGNAVSGATEFADASTQSLFVFLWNADASLSVSGGRGASALADFNANKAIALPDLNARALFGIDGMGSSATGRLTNALFASGSATVLGSSGGEGAHTLTLAETVAHTHTGTTQANAAFSLTFTTASAGNHNHTGATSSAGSHNHGGSTGSASHTHTFTTASAGSHNHTGLSGGADTNFQMNGTGISLSLNTKFGITAVSGGGGDSHFLSDATALSTGLSGTWFQDHHHSISTDGAHTHIGTTDSSGALAYSISTDGAHVHTGSTDAGGVHTHTFTTASSGGGGAHNSMPPFVLATCYLVL